MTEHHTAATTFAAATAQQAVARLDSLVQRLALLPDRLAVGQNAALAAELLQVGERLDALANFLERVAERAQAQPTSALAVAPPTNMGLNAT
jgi:hypothetical protein